MSITPEEIISEIRRNVSYYREIVPAHHFEVLAKLKSRTPGFQGHAIQTSIKQLDYLGRGGMVFISGPVGVGKTVAAFVLAIAWSKTLGRSFLFTTSRDILKNEFDKDKIDFEKYSNLVIIDDLGREFISESNAWGTDVFEALIDRSYSHKLPRIFTTNLTPDEIRERYGARVYDRMRESAKWLTVAEPGGSLRGKEAAK